MKSEDNVDEVVVEVLSELQTAFEKFPKFNSAHEGYAILKEEVDELWREIKTKDSTDMRDEAIQVAAMALRFLNDVCPNPTERPGHE